MIVRSLEHVLLEREAAMAQLDEAFERVVRHGRGECVLLHGEAGIGKTALARGFVDRLATKAKVLIAACEPLYTPRPLGPLVDLAERFEASVSDALHSGKTWNGLFPALFAALRDAPTPTVLVIEDMHWADAATLDFVRYLGRRLSDARALMLLTYRSDEVSAEHPLRRVLGELPATHTTRVALERLTMDAVAALAATGARAARQVFEATGGNPFYVTEVLATTGSGVPPSVNDAVLARFAGLSPEAREIAERVSLFPNQVSVTQLTAIAPAAANAINECTQHGLLVSRDGALAFRHEIARVAVHQSIAPFRRADLHAAVFASLRAQDDDDAALARQVHHAEGAGLVDEVVRLSPRAARYATTSGAHREAAAFYALVLRHGDTRASSERAALLEARSIECALAGLHGEAIRVRSEALAMRSALGDARGEGINLRWLARLHGWGEDFLVAVDCARQSVAVLERVTPDAELANAYSTLSHLYLLAEQNELVRIWGSKAVALAEKTEDPAALSQALACVGIARLRVADDPDAWQMLERSIELALSHRLDTEAAFGFEVLHATLLAHHRYAAAIAHAERAVAHCEARGLDGFALRIRLRRGFAYLQTGRWAHAADELARVRAEQVLPPMELAVLNFVSALLALRSGGRGAREELLQVVAAMGHLNVRIWFTSTAAACAESAWLAGDQIALREAIEPALAQALAIHDAWRAGELAAWLVRGGNTPDVSMEALAGPYTLEVAGRVRDAADAWEQLACPYEQAVALSCGDEAAQREALQRFEQLGAGPAAEVARRGLRAAGARGVQRGPQPRTRVDPLGLTAHERGVFDLLREGLTNSVIAERLHRSVRTVEHHVAAILAKLDAHTRAELIAKFGAASGGHDSEPQG